MQALPHGTSVKVLTTSCGDAHESIGVTAWSEDETILEEIGAEWAAQSGADVSAGYFPLLVRPVGGPGFELHVDDATRAAVVQDLNAAAVNDTTHIRQVLALAADMLLHRHQECLLTDSLCMQLGTDGRAAAPSVQRLAQILSGLRPCLSIRPSLFAAGPVAKCVAESMNELDAWPQALPGSSLRPAALVLVDRAADLPGVLQAPSSTIGLAGRPLTAEGGSMGSSAATWWHAAVESDPGSHSHASKVLHEALAGLDASLFTTIAPSDLEAAQRHGVHHHLALVLCTLLSLCCSNSACVQAMLHLHRCWLQQLQGNVHASMGRPQWLVRIAKEQLQDSHICRMTPCRSLDLLPAFWRVMQTALMHPALCWLLYVPS